METDVRARVNQVEMNLVLAECGTLAVNIKKSGIPHLEAGLG